MTTTTVTTPEASLTTHEHQPSMGKIERYGRIIGGYALGFVGVNTTVAGLLSGNIATAAIGGGIGLGMVYGADRILRPIHAELYGEIPSNESRARRVGRFATFAASLTVTYAGLSLISNAVFPNSWTGADFNFGERVFSGGLGVLAYMGGTAIERISKRPGFINGTPSVAAETDSVAPRDRIRSFFGSGDREPDEEVTATFGARLITMVRDQRDKTKESAVKSYNKMTERFSEPRRSELRANFAQELVA